MLCLVCITQRCGHKSLGIGLQGNGPYLPPRSGAVRKPSQSPSLLLVPRRPRTRPDYTKIIAGSCGQAGSGTQTPRCKDEESGEQPLHRREAPMRA